MAVLSYYDQIEQLGVKNPGPATIDLSHGPIYSIDLDFWKACFGKEKGSSEHAFYVSREELFRNMKKKRTDKFWSGGKYYTEIKLPRAFMAFSYIFGTRSSVARLGMMAHRFRDLHGVPEDIIPVLIRIKGTSVRMPKDYKISQIALMKRGTKSLTKQETTAALSRGDIKVENPPQVMDDGSILLHVGKGFSKYTGGELSLKPIEEILRHFKKLENETCLEYRNSNEFYIGCTEKITIGANHMGLMIGIADGYLVHLNAPIVHPTSDGEQTLEIYTKNRRGRIETGQPACKLVPYQLTQPVPLNLKGTYSHPDRDGYSVQEGPGVSGIGKWK